MAKKLSKVFENTIRDTFQQMQDGELRLVAAALAFSTLLSLVPFAAVTLSIFKTIGGLEFLYPKVESTILSYVEQGTGRQALQIFQKIIHRVHGGVIGTTGAVALFMSSFKLLQDMERGINRVWNVKEKRPFFQRVGLNVCLFIGIPGSLAVYAGFRSLAFVKPLQKAGYHGLIDFVLLFFLLFVIYKFVPYIKVRIRPALVAALVASLTLFAVKGSFTWVAKKIFTFSKLYGGLAALPVLCLWILAVWFVILGGVAFCASTQKRKWLEETYGFDFSTGR